ncbi:MAG TPA: V-type proton ATPase subunit E [Candidatus Ornithospirochaeta avicola]|uniref:V-type ATP synthase subunit E n=1 Tax=Candidatus Ornithospirochaeta avicola TaxID=2840896 RepID=A0A9D1PUK8_9SPIO|nr:V-type proton ATPase subunit E [Candidatus Ornithospirochaeta avicola]
MSNALIDGIILEAEEKAKKMILEAEEECSSIKEGMEDEIEKSISAEERITALRLKQIELKEESAKKSIDRISELKKLDCSYNLVMKKVDERIRSMVSDGSISKYLVLLIAEAAIGLEKKSATVSFSKTAPVNDIMLRQAESMVKEISGREINLTLDENYISEIGVVLTSSMKKVSYNNTLDTRIRRYSREINKIIQDENAR